MKPSRVPGPQEWEGYKSDHATVHAYRLMFGKALSAIVPYFGGARSIERGDELLHLPRRAFQYYVLSFVEYLHSAEAKDDADSASVFLRLLANREHRDPGSVAAVYPLLQETVDFVASHQEYFDASPDIYGSFEELGESIRRKCG